MYMKKIIECLFKDKVIVNGKPINFPDFGWIMTYLFNMRCRLPILSIPSGIASNGIQIVGKPYEDISVFLAGFNIEKIEPWFNSQKYRSNL